MARQRSIAKPSVILLMIGFACWPGLVDTGRAGEAIPLLYSTDLHHPHVDPDDHFDLATLFSLAECDLRGIVLDCGARQREAPGAIPLGQLKQLTGRQVPWAVGLATALASADDDGRDQPAEYQAGVQLVLDSLRSSRRKVTLFTTGSLRDIAAAWLREPQLLRDKIERLYINIGDPATGSGNRQSEYNVTLDRQAYLCVMNSGLPIYWCPCFDGPLGQRGRHGTYWRFRQGDVLQTAPLQLQNWFLFALAKPPGADPIAYLSASQDTEARDRAWSQMRSMWCTAPMLHAVGREIYEQEDGRFVALAAAEAARRGLAERRARVFDFEPVRISARQDAEGLICVDTQFSAERPNAFLFRVQTEAYDRILRDCLQSLYRGLGQEPRPQR